MWPKSKKKEQQEVLAMRNKMLNKKTDKVGKGLQKQPHRNKATRVSNYLATQVKQLTIRRNFKTIISENNCARTVHVGILVGLSNCDNEKNFLI